MKSTELFGVLVRIVGLGLIAFGLREVVSGIGIQAVEFLGYPRYGEELNVSSTIYYLIRGGPTLAVGVYCFFWSDSATRLTYRQS